MKRFYFLTFAGGIEKYKHARDRLNVQAVRSGFFNKVFSLDDSNLAEIDSNWWKKHRDFIASNKRLYGYAIWKPLIIWHTLCSLPDGIILIYSDAGAEVCASGGERFRYYEALVEVHGLIGFHTPYDVGSWTKGAVIRYFGVKLEDSMLSEKQLCSNMFIIKNNTKNRVFFRVASEVIVGEGYSLVDDSPSPTTNPIGFVENRHDQSILDMLMRTLDHGIMFSEEEHTHNDLWRQGKFNVSIPIQQMRNLTSTPRIQNL